MDTALATPSNSDFQRDCVRRRDPVTKGLSMPAAESDPTPTMVARISLDDVIIYANEAFAAYLGTPKRNLVGSSLPEVAALCTGEVSSCFARPGNRPNEQSSRFGRGREGIFEAQMHSDGGMLDVVLDEIRAPGSRAAGPRGRGNLGKAAHRGGTARGPAPGTQIPHGDLHAASGVGALRRKACDHGS